MKRSLKTNYEKLSNAGMHVENEDEFAKGENLVNSFQNYYVNLDCFKHWNGLMKAETCLLIINLSLVEEEVNEIR